ncbi:hypothetical protein BDQ12DRAFT_726934 [Crucibulum laeve]|uniref:Uncharacterized protein n=1 Tax=Crucibulum laeve TaxID=68775 RepID=A0A5C3LMI9_9AGAR|nr:hypothetical protein BDQ12DRAFT_726934 [Crucibulum laeve]
MSFDLHAVDDPTLSSSAHGPTPLVQAHPSLRSHPFHPFRSKSLLRRSFFEDTGKNVLRASHTPGRKGVLFPPLDG